MALAVLVSVIPKWSRGNGCTYDRRLVEEIAAGQNLSASPPLRSDTPGFCFPDWISPRPNTDVALMMGLAHTLVSEDRLDRPPSQNIRLVLIDF